MSMMFEIWLTDSPGRLSACLLRLRMQWILHLRRQRGPDLLQGQTWWQASHDSAVYLAVHAGHHTPVVVGPLPRSWLALGHS